MSLDLAHQPEKSWAQFQLNFTPGRSIKFGTSATLQRWSLLDTRINSDPHNPLFHHGRSSLASHGFWKKIVMPSWRSNGLLLQPQNFNRILICNIEKTNMKYLVFILATLAFTAAALAETKPTEVKIKWNGDYAHNSSKHWSKDNPYDSGFSKNFKNGTPQEFGDVKKDGELDAFIYSPKDAK